jgi:PleD family two-component response regulator
MLFKQLSTNTMATDIQNKTVLVIDDSTTNVVLLEAILNNKGFNIDTALSVKEAYSLMAKKKPNLILLDLLMPRINGYEFLKELKSDEKNNDIPVIVISALSDNENVQKALQLGATDFIKKPVDIQQLLEKVNQELNK